MKTVLHFVRIFFAAENDILEFHYNDWHRHFIDLHLISVMANFLLFQQTIIKHQKIITYESN